METVVQAIAERLNPVFGVVAPERPARPSAATDWLSAEKAVMTKTGQLEMAVPTIAWWSRATLAMVLQASARPVYVATVR
jgi:hypothetical protein